jgi:hypothetical protein
MVARYCASVALAKLALALMIMASLTIRGSAIYAEAAQGSAFDASGKADQVAMREVDLESLKAKPAAVAAIGRTVYEEAGRILDRLAKSNFPDEKVRADTVIALEEVAKLSHRLATASEVLADAVETASTGQLAGSAALTRALEEFDIAEKAFDRSADELLKQVRRVRSHEVKRESLADEIAGLDVDVPEAKPDQSAVSQLQMLKQEAIEGERVELQALVRSTRTYGAAQSALMAAISELAPLLAPPVAREAPTPGISLSVYGFFDQQRSEEEGYGLYTYVLLAAAPGTSQRNAAFLRRLLASTGRTDSELAAVRRQLNIFYVPTQNRIQALVIARSSADAAAAIAAPSVYDYQQAGRLLVRLCTESVSSNPKLCASAWRGPYFLTLSEPLGASAALSPTRLVVDLSDIHERAFGEFIRAVKEQVMRRDFTDRQKVDTLRLRLLDITLKAADWLDPIKEGIAEIVFFEENAAK